MMVGPSWRAAVRGALRDRAELATVAAAVALLLVAATADVLVVWASGQAAVEQLLAASAGGRVGADTADVVASLPADAPEIGDRVEQRLSALEGYDEPVRQRTSLRWLVLQREEEAAPVVRVDDRVASAVLFHREGAIESLDVVAGPDPDGEVWLPAPLAEELGLAPGDELEVGLEPVGPAGPRTGAPTVLAGTYATVDGRPSGVLVDSSVRLPRDPDDPASTASLVLADDATMQRLGEEFEDLQLATLQVAPTTPPRYEELRAGVAQLDQLESDLVTPDSSIGSLVFEQFNSPAVDIATNARRLTTRAAETAQVVGERIVGAATAGVVLAVATLVAAVVAAARRRREQTRLELVQGTSPSALAARAAVAAAPAVLLGAVVGRALVLPIAELVLPAARIPAPAVAALWPRTIAVAVATLLVVVLARGADAWIRLVTLDGGSRTRSVPVVPVLLAVAVVVVAGSAVGPPRPPTDPLVMALPLVVTAAVAVLVLRALVRLVPGGDERPSAPSATWLARRRAVGQTGRLVAVGAVVATTSGLVAHTAVLQASGQEAVEAKVAALAGARVVVAVPGPASADDPAVATPHAVVIQAPRVEVLPQESPATLLAVDPASFAAVATWPTGTGPEVLDALATADGTSLPVIVLPGDEPVDDSGTVERSGWWSLPYEVVARPEALPGAEAGRTLMLTTQDALFARLDEELDPRGAADPGSSDPDGPWSTEVWFDTEVATALGGLEAAVAPTGRSPRLVRTLGDVRTEPRFLATTWSLGVLSGLAVVVLALALLLVGGTRARATDEAGLELAVLARLGVSPGRQRVAALLERVLLVVVAGAIGIVTGIALAVAVAGDADPAPRLAPPLPVRVPTGAVVGLLVVLAAAGVVAGLLDHRAARRADVEEALRVAR